jgi:hypothetical protein
MLLGPGARLFVQAHNLPRAARRSSPPCARRPVPPRGEGGPRVNG